MEYLCEIILFCYVQNAYEHKNTLTQVLRISHISELPDRVFAEASTRDQWRHRGDEFYKHHLYNVAAKCYVRSGDSDKEKMSRAQQRALEASRLCDNPRKLRHEFLFAAEQYLDCGMTTEAARCLCNAKETLLAAQLYEKMGQVRVAADR